VSTVKRRTPSAEIDWVRASLKEAGLRCTAARTTVMQELRRANAPISHSELAEKLVPMGFDKATVFRNLIDLSEAGLVYRSELGDHVWRFELRDPEADDEGRHPHFVCVECGSVTCLADVELDAAAERQAAEVGRVTEILLKGQCRNCG
jgi:Fur family ferric uptake transcriptional regulator